MSKVKIKVLTLIQPWAQLVVMGAKEIETRSWQTNHRGTLYIHASKHIPLSVTTLCKSNPHFGKYIQDIASLPKGCIVGKVNIDAILPTYNVDEGISDEERAFGDYSNERFAWMLSSPIEFTELIRCSGKLSVWEHELNEDYLKKVEGSALIEIK